MPRLFQRCLVRRLIVLLVSITASMVSAGGAQPPRTPHALSSRSLSPAGGGNALASPLRLKPRQKVKVAVSEDVGRYAAGCICDMIRAKAMETCQTDSLKAAIQQFAPAFAEAVRLRVCLSSALDRKRRELETQRQSGSSDDYVPDIDLAQQPYEQLASRHHYYIGFGTGICLCWKDVQDYTIYSLRRDVAGVLRDRRYREECRAASATMAKQGLSLRYLPSFTGGASAANQQIRYRFVARERRVPDNPTPPSPPTPPPPPGASSNRAMNTRGHGGDTGVGIGAPASSSSALPHDASAETTPPWSSTAELAAPRPLEQRQRRARNKVGAHIAGLMRDGGDAAARILRSGREVVGELGRGSYPSELRPHALSSIRGSRGRSGADTSDWYDNIGGKVGGRGWRGGHFNVNRLPVRRH